MKKLLALTFIFCLFSCSENTNTPTQDSSFTLSKLVGVAEKGPFSKGTVVKITGLDKDFNLTDAFILTKTIDDLGNFSLSNINLPTKFAQIEVTGNYFSETTGKYTQATLQSIVNLENTTQANVNILTHLEKNRVEYLIKSGKSFEEAKKTAQKEILDVFGISIEGYTKSELLALKSSGALVALSIMMDVSENPSSLWSSIASDIASDGILDSPEVFKTIYNHISSIDIEKTKQLLQDKLSIILPDFQEYLDTFLIQNKQFTVSFEVTDVICNGDNNGRIITTINGGTAPFSFSWSNFETTKDIENAFAGSYIVTVTDASGYIVSETIEVFESQALTASVSVVNASSSGNDGVIEVTATGGSGSYTYGLQVMGNIIAQTDFNVFSNLTPGEYSIIVTDSNGCIVQTTTTVITSS